MKAAIAAGFFVFIFLFVVTTFSPSSEYRQLAQQEGFVPEQIEAGWQLAVERKFLFWSSTFLTLIFLTVLVFSGWARKLADHFARWTGNRWWLTVLLMGAFCFLAQKLLLFPLSVISLEHWRAWGMTERSFLDWLADYGKTLALSAGIGAVLLVGFYGLLRWFPRTWWVWTTLLGGLLGIAFAFVLPIWIAPLFNEFRPLEDKELNQRIQKMAEEAGVPVQEVLVVDASRQGKHTNAYFTGFGSTRRIVLYDTLLKSHKDPEELESILGHEIGHWQHNHILIGIGLATLGALVGFFLLGFILRWAVNRRPFSLHSPADPAGWPLILLLSLLASWVVRPVENAISRHFERQADWTALELAGNPDAFIEAEKRLARDNKSNLMPNPYSVWMFGTHPPTVERIQMAREWLEKRSSGLE